jgi:hypothetical protein
MNYRELIAITLTILLAPVMLLVWVGLKIMEMKE